jgi:hypothetical protein
VQSENRMHDGCEAPTGADGKLVLDGLFEHRFAAERSTIIARHRSFAATDTSRAGAGWARRSVAPSGVRRGEADERRGGRASQRCRARPAA